MASVLPITHAEIKEGIRVHGERVPMPFMPVAGGGALCALSWGGRGEEKEGRELYRSRASETASIAQTPREQPQTVR